MDGFHGEDQNNCLWPALVAGTVFVGAYNNRWTGRVVQLTRLISNQEVFENILELIQYSTPVPARCSVGVTAKNIAATHFGVVHSVWRTNRSALTSSTNSRKVEFCITTRLSLSLSRQVRIDS